MSELKQSLVTQRAVLKRRITNSLKTLADEDSVTWNTNGVKLINEYLTKITELDDSIIDCMTEGVVGEDLSTAVDEELDKQSSYSLTVRAQLSSLTTSESTSTPTNSKPINVTNCTLKLPDLKCESFSGEGSSSLQFHNFLAQFNNIFGLRDNLTNSTKLSYLKSHLKGYAGKLIQHLTVVEPNYDIALDLLRKEFLNEGSLINDLLKKLFSLKVDYDPEFLGTKIYVNEVRCILSDLKVYNYDFVTERAGSLLLSFIAFQKLPSAFQQELVRKIDKNFPTIDDIFENYAEVIETLKLRQPKIKSDFDKVRSQTISKPGVVGAPDSNFRSNASTYNSSKSVRDPTKMCKFCTAPGHSMLGCKKYPNYEARRKRCAELKVCAGCSSSKHTQENCLKRLDFPCIRCQSREHISALCPNNQSSVHSSFCINSTCDSGRSFLLPILTVKLGSGDKQTVVRCLLDSGSQRSYISTNVLNRLNLTEVNKTRLMVNTFIDSSVKDFKETGISVELAPKRSVLIPFLVSDDVNLSFSIEGLKEGHANLAKKFKLAEQFNSDDVELEGLLGVDAVQCLSRFELVQCLNGRAFQLDWCIVPFGHIDSFLTFEQLDTKYSKLDNSGDLSESQFYSIVNFALSPAQTCFDPVGPVIEDSLVEEKLDRMFSLDSLGISEEISDYDQLKIEEFNEGIELKNGFYHVKLPWNENIPNVPSNFRVASAILDRVVANLRRDGLYEKYAAVLNKQLTDDILEEIEVNDFDKHVFIPHRAVLKEEENVTTKLRIVLNCSLKIGQNPSLNEAAYPGVNLTNNLVELLIKVRAEKYLVMSDIRAAFLMVKLSLESDRNKFTILWKDSNDKLIAYRYKTIVFGFISSPFILQHCIRFHLNNYTEDNCNDILRNNVYVDNVFFTGNNPDCLLTLYHETFRRMMSGGFELRSWVSNSPELRDEFSNDDRAATDSKFEKLLGYRYVPEKDTIMLNEVEVDNRTETFTKRTVLASIARVFDPMGFVNPVLAKAKVFLKNLWNLKLDWDEPIPDNLLNDWNKISTNLMLTSTLEIERFAYDGKFSLVIFCDSSKLLYGFSCYFVSHDLSTDTVSSNLIFSKLKNAPNKEKTLPTLELMSAYLALRCINMIIDPVKDRVMDVTICLDSQVALSWILSKDVKSKNVCAKNRVKDITGFVSDVKTNYNLDVKFKYIPTELNPADLITRGLTFSELQAKMQFWMHGPEFLGQAPTVWPERQLGCLSEKNKIMTLTLAVREPPLIEVDRFSNVHKLLRVTALVLGFVCKLRKKTKSKLDLTNDARRYLIKTEQSKSFATELNFLKCPKDKVPCLVNNLNLFIDEAGLLRCKGRLTNCDYFEYEARNPVLLPKDSVLTNLLIADVHHRCKHLGIATTLTAIRKEGFWIPKGRVAVKAVLSRCIICKKMNAHAFVYPKKTDYLKAKTDFVKPYDHTGIDFTGHIYVKLENQLYKMYLLVFTCLNIRSVHLELLPDMSCKSFLMAFIRFCNSYNFPSAVYSDNANTFIQGVGILSESSVDNEFTDFLVRSNIKHVRIPLYAAWVGSAWERMIKTIKNSLHKVIGRKYMQYFELITILSDVQNAINNRPLTYRSDDDLLTSITPNSFLKFNPGCSLLLDGVAGSELPVPTRKTLVKALESREEIFEKFKSLWAEEYLLALRESSRDVYQDNWVDIIAPGDVVLVSTPNKPRTHWIMGRVVQNMTGRDGCTRSAKIVRPDRSEGIYPINMLYPLELSVAPVLNIVDRPARAEHVVNRPPKRAAALICESKLRAGN